MKNVKRIFLSGGITGVENYKEKFESAKKLLSKFVDDDVVIISPTDIDLTGVSYEMCLNITILLLDTCDAICLLPNWNLSRGSIIELENAINCNKKILTINDYEHSVVMPE